MLINRNSRSTLLLHSLSPSSQKVLQQSLSASVAQASFCSSSKEYTERAAQAQRAVRRQPEKEEEEEKEEGRQGGGREAERRGD